MTSHTGFAAQPREQHGSAFGLVAFALVVILAIGGAYTSVQVFKGELSLSEVQPQKLPEKKTEEFGALSKVDRETMLSKLRNEVASDQLATRSLSDISSMLFAEENAEAGKQLALLVSKRSLRDVGSQIQALNILLERGKVEEPLQIIDGLVRSRPVLSEALFDQMLVLSSRQEGEAGLARLLATNPPWRPSLFARAAATKADSQLIYRLLIALKATQSPPTDYEIRSLLSALVAAKNYAVAYYVWLEMLPPNELQFVGNLFDGEFELPLRNLYFDWNITRTKTIEVKTTPRATGSADQVLRVDFIGNRDPVSAVFQFTRLSPGEYVFSGDQKAEGLKTESGLTWRLSCLDGSAGVVAQSPKLSATSQWSGFSVQLSIPADCTTQLLALVAASNAKLDQQISGSASFDKLGLVSKVQEP